MPVQWRALYIDDDTDYLRDVKKYLDGVKVLEPDHQLSLEVMADFGEALTLIEKVRYDLIIIDVRLGAISGERAEEEGVKILDEIKARRFVPIIFYTALPAKVNDLASQLVKVIDKKDSEEKLLEAIKDIFDKRLPIVNRALLTHMEEVQRDYMWHFVSENWDEFGGSRDTAELAILLARRLSVSLCRENIGNLVSKIGSKTRYKYEPGKAHPVEYYLIPPVEDDFMTGDIFTHADGKTKRYEILLNPCCDFGHNNVDNVLFSSCLPFEEQPEYTELATDLDNTKKRGSVKSLIKDSRSGKQSERFFFLPKAFSIPDLVVDFQELYTMKLMELKEKCSTHTYDRVASLDSPFAETLLNKFSHYYGRIGKPAIRDEIVMERIMGKIR